MEIGGRVCSAKYYIDASNPDNIARLINSHCKPNCKMEQWIAEDEGRPMPCLVLVADRDIKKGEELYFYYRSSEGFPPDGCHCGSDNCWSGREPDSPEVPPTGSGKKRKRGDEIYCTCQSPSYGNMIACDDETCSYKWFHWECAGIMVQPDGQWICHVCAASPERQQKRRTRKKSPAARYGLSMVETGDQPTGCRISSGSIASAAAEEEVKTINGVVYRRMADGYFDGKFFGPAQRVEINGKLYNRRTVLTRVRP